MAEHLGVAAVVLKGQAEIETLVPQVVDRLLLELSGHGVVAALAHQEGVPADPVAGQPGLGQRVDPGRAARQENHPEAGIEEVEERLDLLDHLVLAAGVEEAPPVGPGVLEVMLPAGGVGQDAVDVDDDRRTRLDRPGTPRPVLPHG